MSRAKLVYEAMGTTNDGATIVLDTPVRGRVKVHIESDVMTAERGSSVADSLHLATAIIAQCDLFLTNDLRLTNFSEVPVATL